MIQLPNINQVNQSNYLDVIRQIILAFQELSDQQGSRDTALLGEINNQVKGLRSDMSRQFTEVREEFTEMKGEITGIKTEITEMKGEITEMKGEITGIKTEIKSLSEKYDQSIDLLKIIAHNTRRD